MQYLRRSWTLPNDSKHNEARFSTISTDKLYLRVAQIPRSPDLAIFVLTTDKTDYLTPCACARGNNDNNNDDTTDYFTPCACARGNKEGGRVSYVTVTTLTGVMTFVMIFTYKVVSQIVLQHHIAAATTCTRAVSIHWTGPLDWTTGLEYWTRL